MTNIKISDHFSYSRLLRFVYPTVVMMIVTSIYSIVDGFFVSNVAGKNAFAAVNLVMPVLMIIGSFGFMIGSGGSALVSKTLGQGKKKDADRYFSMLIITVCIAGITVSSVAFIFMRKVSLLLGATDAMLEECVIYGRTICVGSVAFMLQNCFQSFLVTAEKPKLGLAVTVASGLTNMVLDFVLVYLFDMGVFGAALATVISQTVGAVIPLVYFTHNKNSLLRLYRVKPEKRPLARACSNGFSEMLTNISISFISMLYNARLLEIAQEDGIVAYGVIMYVNLIFLGFFFGYAVGTAPIVGYHYGARNTGELKNMFRKSLFLTAITAIAMTAAGIALSKPLSIVFVGYDQQLMNMTARGMTLYSLSFLLCGFNIFASSFFTALSNGLISAIISVLRMFVFQLAAVLILPELIGIDGIWLSVFCAEALTFIFTAVIFAANRKKYGYA